VIHRNLVLLGLGVSALGSAAYAAETITYKYDARGRLVQVVRTGVPNNAVTSTYTHDKANNRATVVVTKP
jgi:YD repeat-containing protein